MSHHLSEDQFARRFLEPPANGELRHIDECSECRAALDNFGHSISSFRSAVRGQIDARLALCPSAEAPWSNPPARAAGAMWRWAWIAATTVIALVVMAPFFTKKKEPDQVINTTQTLTSPDALMNAVNLHVSRTVPAPMERIMTLMPSDELITESGGVQ